MVYPKGRTVSHSAAHSSIIDAATLKILIEVYWYWLSAAGFEPAWEFDEPVYETGVLGSDPFILIRYDSTTCSLAVQPVGIASLHSATRS